MLQAIKLLLCIPYNFGLIGLDLILCLKVLVWKPLMLVHSLGTNTFLALSDSSISLNLEDENHISPMCLSKLSLYL